MKLNTKQKLFLTVLSLVNGTILLTFMWGCNQFLPKWVDVIVALLGGLSIVIYISSTFGSYMLREYSTKKS